MILLKCWLYGLLLLVLPQTIYSLPTLIYRKQQQQEEYTVDINRFSSLFSTHLLFDHLDGTLSILSKRISLHFQDLIQVTTQFDLNDDEFIVDVELLKSQLQGAIGSFIEDSLPNIWNARASVIDKSTLSNYIQQVITLQYCQEKQKNTCIEKNAQQIISTIDHYIQNHLFNIIQIIVTNDLPPLFKTTQSHVKGILAHFSHYLHLNTTATMNHSFENSIELISYLNSAIHLYHSSSSSLLIQDSSLLEKYTLLSKVED